MYTIIALLLIAICSVSCQPALKKPDGPQRPARKPDMEALDRRANSGGFQNFRSEQLAEGDVEIRIFVTGGFVPLRGFIIRRREQAWESYLFPPISSEGDSAQVLDITNRSTAWDDLEKRSVQYQADNKNSAESENELLFNDGQTVTLEFRRAGEPELILTSGEPCSQDTKAGIFLCDLTKEAEKNAGVYLMSEPPDAD